MIKSGFCTLIGPPNAGKSTLINRILRYPLNIVSSKPQTTRNSTLGIYHGENTQIIFNDTPGLLKKKLSLLDREMDKTLQKSLRDADIVLFLLDVSEPWDSYEDLLEKIREKFQLELLVAFNKIDENPDIPSQQLSCPFPHFFISAKEGTNIDSLFCRIESSLKDSVEYFPKDVFSNRTERFFAKEYIRESLLENLHQEVPHSSFVDIEKMDNSKDPVQIQAIIYVAKESHKGIVVGKQGSMIKKIGTTSRSKIEKLLDRPVFLECLVKVQKNWNDDPHFLKKLEYY